MSRKRFEDMNCGVAQALEQVGDWWTLLIVRDAFLGATRFGEFERNLGIAKNILSDRLQKLLRHEIMEKCPRPGDTRSEYHLTRKGRDLWLVLTAMRLWSDRWVFGAGNEPIVARERGSDRVLAELVAVDEDGAQMDPSQLVLEPGPGASSAPAHPKAAAS